MCVRIAIQNATYTPESLQDDDGMVYLDLSDGFSLRLFKRLEELTDINKIKTDSIIGFSIPITPKNDMLLKHTILVNRVDNMFEGLSVIIFNGSNVIGNKKLYVVRKNIDTYEIEVRADKKHWAILAENLLLKDVQLRDTDFEFTTQNIKDIQALGGYVDGEEILRFPVVNYGKFTDNRIKVPYAVTQHIGVSDFRPYFALLGILQKGFCSIGWTFKSPLFESDYGRRLITYILTKDYADNDIGDRNDVELKLLTTKAFITEVGNYTPIPFTAIKDPSNGWNQATYRYGTSGVYDVSGNVSLELNINPTQIPIMDAGYPDSFDRVRYMYIRLAFVLPNNTDYGLEIVELGYKISDFIVAGSHTGTVKLDIKLIKNDFQLDPGSQAYVIIGCDDPFITTANYIFVKIIQEKTFVNFDCKKVLIQEDTILPINKLIDSEYNLLDIFKGSVHLCAGKIITDYATNTVTVYPSSDAKIYDDEEIEGFFTNESPIDYSDIMQDNSEEIETLPLETERYHLLKFKGDGDEAIKKLNLPKDKPFLSYKIDLGSSVENETVKQLENPFFAATAQGKYMWEGSPVAVDMPYMLDNQDGNTSFEIEPRILYWAGKIKQSVSPLGGVHANVLRIFGDDVYDIPTAYMWTDVLFGVPLNWYYSEQNVAYGEHTTQARPISAKKDLFNYFYKRWIGQSLFNLKINVLLFLEQAQYLSINFRNTYQLRIQGRDVMGRIYEVMDYNTCKQLSTPILFIPDRQVSNDCDIIPDGGGDNGNDVCRTNNPLLIIEKLGDCYNFSMGGSSTSTIDTVTFEWKYNGGTWTSAVSLCNPEEAFTVRMIVTYSDNCRSITRISNIDACGNSPVIVPTLNIQDNCITITIGGTVISEIDDVETEITYSLDDGTTWLPYTDGCIPLGDATKILINATIVYVDGCADSIISSEYTIPIITDCNKTDADVECDSHGILTMTGTVYGSDAIDIVRYRPVGQSYWFIWDGAMPLLPQPIEYQRIVIYCSDLCPTYCSDIHTWQP